MEPQEYEKMYQLEDSHWWFVNKRRLIRRFLKTNSKILDIGCGTGANLKAFSIYGRAIGIDISPLAIRSSLLRGCPFLVRASINNLPFKNNIFDTVTLLDVLYHRMVREDKKALVEVYRVLKKEGRVIITDSALEFLRGPHDVAVHGARRYDKARLRQLVEEAGFNIQRLTYTYFLLFPVICAIRLFKRTGSSSDLKSVHPILNYVLLMIQGIEGLLLKIVNLPIGSSILCVARKVSQ